MRCGEHDAAGCAMSLDDLRQGGRRGLVETIGRFVEQPDVGARDDGAGERGALALAGREDADRNVGEMADAEIGQRGVDPLRPRAVQPCPEAPKPRAKSAPRSKAAASSVSASVPLMRTVPAKGASQPRDDAQQARLADAVGTRDERALSRRQIEIEPREQQPPAAPAGQAP